MDVIILCYNASIGLLAKLLNPDVHNLFKDIELSGIYCKQKEA